MQPNTVRHVKINSSDAHLVNPIIEFEQDNKVLTERFIEKKSSNSIKVCKADPKKGLYNSISTIFAHAAF